MSKGHCRRGAACTFAHGRNHLRVLDADGKGTKLPMEEMKLAAAQPDAGMSEPCKKGVIPVVPLDMF